MGTGCAYGGSGSGRPVGVVTNSSDERDRVASIASGLRCPACQSVSVEEASAPIARDIRDSIATQVAAGRTDAEIKAFFVDKYGEWVLLDAPPRGRTLLLWLLPALGLGFGVLAIGSRLRKPASTPLAEDEAGTTETAVASSPRT